MADYGLKITPKDIDANTAADKDILLQFKNPLMLLDSQATVSFQNINIFFAKDTPNPDGINSFTQDTEVYRFKHGYKYIPATWLLFLNSANVNFKYGYAGGFIARAGAASSAALFYRVDKDNAYIYVRKGYIDGLGLSPTDISSYAVKLRVYVFANDIGA